MVSNLIHFFKKVNYTMKTRKTKKLKKLKKTKKMKGGYIYFDGAEWRPAIFKPDGSQRGDIAMSYSSSEASFLNKLGVPRIDIKAFFSNPTNANEYLNRIASGILEDAHNDVFPERLSNMRSVVNDLKAAHQKRSESDTQIDEMGPDRRAELGITEESRETHKKYTFNLKQMLDAIKEFMIPYETKESRLKPKPTVKVVKEQIRNPFLFYRTHELSDVVPHKPDEEYKGAEVRESKEDKGAEVLESKEVRNPKNKKKKGKAEKSKKLDISTNYKVHTFYSGIVEPTSLCFTDPEKQQIKMFIFSKGLINSLVDTTAGLTNSSQVITQKLNLSFCELKGDRIFVTYDNVLHIIKINTPEITIGIIPNSEYKGIYFLNDTDLFCVGSNKLWSAQSDLTFGQIPLTVGLKDPMGIRGCLNFMVIADSGHNRIVIINYSDSLLTPPMYTIIGTSEAGFKDGRTGGGINTPKFNRPIDVLILQDQSIIVSDTGNHSIRRIYRATIKPETPGDPEELGDWITETIAGNGSPGFQDGIGGEVQFNEPHGLSLFLGYIYVADKNNNAIRIIEANNDMEEF
jgi:hypothetical protein